jgi:hypothetical protein
MAAEQKDPMQVMAKAIDTALNGGTLPLRFHGFVLIVFSLDQEDAPVQHVENVDRKDMIAALKSLVAKFEGQAQMEGHG